MIIYMHISNFLRKSEKYKRDVLHMHDELFFSQFSLHMF